jgi:hypothetical protein
VARIPGGAAAAAGAVRRAARRAARHRRARRSRSSAARSRVSSVGSFSRGEAPRVRRRGGGAPGGSRGRARACGECVLLLSRRGCPFVVCLRSSSSSRRPLARRATTAGTAAAETAAAARSASTSMSGMRTEPPRARGRRAAAASRDTPERARGAHETGPSTRSRRRCAFTRKDDDTPPLNIGTPPPKVGAPATTHAASTGALASSPTSGGGRRADVGCLPGPGTPRKKHGGGSELNNAHSG